VKVFLHIFTQGERKC